MSDTLIKRFTELVETNVPSFVRDNHPGLVTFLEAYYEFLETEYAGNKGSIYANKNLLTYADLDNTLTEFLEYFYREFINKIPRTVLCNKVLLLKHIKNFYKARGTEKSYDLLFRIMFEEDGLQFYYPTIDILRPDSGQWVEETEALLCRVAPTCAYFDVELLFENHTIIGATSGAQAIVDNVVPIYDNNAELYSYELKLSQTGRVGDFSLFELISVGGNVANSLILLPISFTTNLIANPEDLTQANWIAAKVTKQIDGFLEAASSGTHKVSQIVRLDSNNYRFQCQVNPIGNRYVALGDENLFYGIIDLSTQSLLSTSDSAYKIIAVQCSQIDADWFDIWIDFKVTSDNSTHNLSIFSYDLLNGITFTGDVTAGLSIRNIKLFEYNDASELIKIYPGNYINADGFLDDVKKLRDDYYYQEFSYEIKTLTCINEWLDVVKKLVHPAGSLAFGKLRIEPPVVELGVTDAGTSLETYHHTYSEYYLNDTVTFDSSQETLNTLALEDIKDIRLYDI